MGASTFNILSCGWFYLNSVEFKTHNFSNKIVLLSDIDFICTPFSSKVNLKSWLYVGRVRATAT